MLGPFSSWLVARQLLGKRGLGGGAGHVRASTVWGLQRVGMLCPHQILWVPSWLLSVLHHRASASSSVQWIGQHHGAVEKSQ